jgi:hypothetical protein
MKEKILRRGKVDYTSFNLSLSKEIELIHTTS